MAIGKPTVGGTGWNTATDAVIDWVNLVDPETDGTIAAAKITGLSSGSSNVYDARVTYGAVGNGVANDRAAIQAAIDAASTAGGGTVYLKAGTYLITSALVMKRRVILVGDGISAGSGGTIIYQDTASADCLTAADQKDMTVQDLSLVGPASGTGTGVKFTRSTNPDISGLTFRRVQVTGFGAYGFDISNPITSTFDRVLADSCPVGFYLHGVLGIGASPGTSVALINCYAAGCTQSGFRLDNMTYCAFLGCASDACGIAYELLSPGTQGISFVGCGCESMVSGGASYPGIGWKINGPIGVTLSGCYTLDAPNTSVWITGASNAVNVTGFSENTPQAGVVNSIKVDAGCVATISDIAVTKPTSLGGSTVMVNDGGGLNVPGYLFIGGTGYIEGVLTLNSALKLKTTTTAGRPTAASAGAGAVLYDTSLGIPIYSNGTAWRNAAGTTV